MLVVDDHLKEDAIDKNLVSAELAREMEGMDDAAAVERVLVALRIMFGARHVPTPSDAKVRKVFSVDRCVSIFRFTQLCEGAPLTMALFPDRECHPATR